MSSKIFIYAWKQRTIENNYWYTKFFFPFTIFRIGYILQLYGNICLTKNCSWERKRRLSKFKFNVSFKQLLILFLFYFLYLLLILFFFSFSSSSFISAICFFSIPPRHHGMHVGGIYLAGASRPPCAFVRSHPSLDVFQYIAHYTYKLIDTSIY